MPATVYNKPRTSSRTSRAMSIATTRKQLRDNNERVTGPEFSGTAAKPVRENCELGIHTGTTSNPLPYDAVQESGVKYLTPDDFEYYTDRSDRVPGWSSVKEDIKPKDATFRTTKESQLVEGFHKGPKMHQYTVAENNAISSGGQVNPINKMPTYSDGNKV